jgi:hypothetical protein
VTVQTSFSTRAGSVTKPNEDFVGASPRAVVVLDGLTAPPELSTGCAHGTPWYVARLGADLLGTATTDLDVPLADIVAAAIARVADAHADTCDLTDPGTPSSSVALLRIGANSVDYLVLFDSVILVEGPSSIEVVTDQRAGLVAQEEHRETVRHAIGSPEHRAAVRRLVAAQRPHRNTPDGYWVAAAQPVAAQHAVTGSIGRDRVRAAAVLTDGASCLADRYAEVGWTELVALLRESGPEHLISRVREVEGTDPTGARWPRYKRSDDATAAFCLFR